MIKRNRGRTDLGRQQQVWEWGLLIGVGIGLLLLVSFFFDEMGFPRYWSLRQQVSQLEQEIAGLRAGNAQMKIEADRLRHDPDRLEELARETLGFVRKGETVYQLAPTAPSAPGSRTGAR